MSVIEASEPEPLAIDAVAVAVEPGVRLIGLLSVSDEPVFVVKISSPVGAAGVPGVIPPPVIVAVVPSVVRMAPVKIDSVPFKPSVMGVPEVSTSAPTWSPCAVTDVVSLAASSTTSVPVKKGDNPTV